MFPKHHILRFFKNKVDFIVQKQIFMDYNFILISTVYVMNSLNRFKKIAVLAVTKEPFITTSFGLINKTQDFF